MVKVEIHDCDLGKYTQYSGVYYSVAKYLPYSAILSILCSFSVNRLLLTLRFACLFETYLKGLKRIHLSKPMTVTSHAT